MLSNENTTPCMHFPPLKISQKVQLQKLDTQNKNPIKYHLAVR